ncbi:putative membrane protein [Peptoclostridium litorale DSM 5388]|uniref:Phage holin family protein n=1 Tax=Peptoclostridium litorale DSM 5388 TaxID=1121324 RepID=A0A069RIS0_PEPLI|nr:phage holin family protein [Peptoclostridium litorale]KDR96050.1 hypothetical protein CLIT_5c00620 [Peptoclostridium litorale DSM 5388]SIO05830.1 putative membrane protein [Peptoclostridium litorale DSM 5388]
MMKNFIARWIVSALSIFLTAKMLASVDVSGIGATLVAAVILGIVNLFLKPVVLLLTLPINLLTLGLFTLAINGFMLYITAALVPGFEVRGFFGSIIGAVILSIFNMILTKIFDIEE